MLFYQRLLALSITSILLVACQAPQIPSSVAPAPSAPINTQDSQVHQYTLNNGLKVIIKEDHRAPIVMTQIWYNVGSSDEVAGKGGLAHFLEHMMFKDTPLLSGDQYHKLISHFGGNKNAFTSHDYTAYYESLPANQYPIALQIEANRMQNLLLQSDEIATEKKVIQEERRQRTDDNPIAKAYEEFRLLALKNSPKARPVIGAMDEIAELSQSDLTNWYRTWYSPNNATLVIVGDVTAKDVMPWVHKYFDTLKQAELPTRQNLQVPTHNGYQLTVSPQAVTVPSLMMGFNVPSITTNPKDAYALALFADIADGSQSARFEKNLVRDRQLFDSIGASFNLLQKGDGLFTIMATPKAGVSLESAEQAILDELTAISTQPISDSELERGQIGLSASLIFANDSIAEQANTLGMLTTLGLPHDTLEKLPATLRAVSKDSIQQTARNYITKDNLTTIYVVPDSKQ